MPFQRRLDVVTARQIADQFPLVERGFIKVRASHPYVITAARCHDRPLVIMGKSQAVENGEKTCSLSA